MANPTTNYSFAMPTNTDLVKDLPADFEVFGQAVDTQMKTNADAAIAKSLVTTKGDLIAATGASTPARLAVGANDTVLMADSTAATGIKWGTVAAGGMTQLATGTLSGSAVTISSISQSYKNLVLIFTAVRTNAGEITRIRLNNVSTALYQWSTLRSNTNAVLNSTAQTAWEILESNTTNANSATQVVTINNYKNFGHPSTLNTWDGDTNGRASWAVLGSSQTGLDGSITQINIITAGTWAAGNYTLFGVS